MNATRPRDWSDSFIFNVYLANVHSLPARSGLKLIKKKKSEKMWEAEEGGTEEEEEHLQEVCFQLFQQQHSEDPAVVLQTLELCGDSLHPQSLQALSWGCPDNAVIIPN